MKHRMDTLDANEAAARIAYATNEICIIYPITPSSPMGEFADQWSSEERANAWGSVPAVVEMQSEGGAAGAIHGSLQTGALTTTFTASQGLLLMIPNMYKIAGELTPTVFHVAARTIATHALSIFGDHSDVMATRQTGFAMLASASVQEAHDLALVAQAATLESRIPFVHFFDGFRTSHEINKIAVIEDSVIAAMINTAWIAAHRDRSLDPERPVLRGTAQNPDTFFQAREACNPYYEATPEIVRAAMAKLAAFTGRPYDLFDYVGAPDAERVLVAMGSAVETIESTVQHLVAQGEKVGLVIVRLYRPFSVPHFLACLPPTATRIAVLDRTKEPGATGEPLYQDVVSAIMQAPSEWLADRAMPRVVGGRYGLSGKEFTPAMVRGVFEALAQAVPRHGFTVGIEDDVSHTSLPYDASFDLEQADTVRAVFYGLGSDGTVGANKNSIKIIGDETDNFAQGYFVYDSKKSGSRTVSHLRFGPRPIHAPYLISRANFVAVHQFNFLWQIDVLRTLVPGGTLLLNSPYGPEGTWDRLPTEVQRGLLERRAHLHVVDAYGVARETGMGVHINTIMQTCFFAISGVLPREQAIEQIKKAIRKSFAKKGKEVIAKNNLAVDQTLASLHEVPLPDAITATVGRHQPVGALAPAFVRDVLGPMLVGDGDALPVSAMPVDGTFPTGTARWEKRDIALNVPVWDAEICAQCGNCGLVCPHGVIRTKTYPAASLDLAPTDFLSMPLKGRPAESTLTYTLALSVEDCTGCGLCVAACPVKNKSVTGLKAINLIQKPDDLTTERACWSFFETLPQVDSGLFDVHQVRGVQDHEPFFEFSGACAGCGETPYLKLLTQLFGDHMMVANATGCSSIFGGNLPTTPWSMNADGHGPAWSNSLFEDNAEFGLGFRVSLDQQAVIAADLLTALRGPLPDALVDTLLAPADAVSLQRRRVQVADLRQALAALPGEPRAELLRAVSGALLPRSVWIVGGDGWAYDIGFGGLDHVLASGRNVNVLVLDTEVYSNTGGQASKATPRGAVAKFAAAGKATAKKDLGLIGTSYGTIYVARIAMGANPKQAIRAMIEAESFPGPSLIIAYSHCIAHGISMVKGLDQQDAAVKCGHWPLFRFDPRRADAGENPMLLDSRKPSIPFKDYAYQEIRYRMLSLTRPDEAAHLLEQAQCDVNRRWQQYEELAQKI